MQSLSHMAQDLNPLFFPHTPFASFAAPRNSPLQTQYCCLQYCTPPNPPCPCLGSYMRNFLLRPLFLPSQEQYLLQQQQSPHQQWAGAFPVHHRALPPHHHVQPPGSRPALGPTALAEMRDEVHGAGAQNLNDPPLGLQSCFHWRA